MAAGHRVWFIRRCLLTERELSQYRLYTKELFSDKKHSFVGLLEGTASWTPISRSFRAKSSTIDLYYRMPAIGG
jgi:hypothetical protein